jgi:hypothetical protein
VGSRSVAVVAHSWVRSVEDITHSFFFSRLLGLHTRSVSTQVLRLTLTTVLHQCHGSVGSVGSVGSGRSARCVGRVGRVGRAVRSRISDLTYQIDLRT